jgi:hypothetical protein
MWAALKATSIGVKIGMLIAILAAFAAVAMIGYNKGLNVSKIEILNYKNASLVLASRLNKAQGQVDVKVVTEYKDRVSVVKETEYKNRDVIRTKVVGFNLLTKGWVYAYNQSVLGLPIDPTLAADATPSTTNELLALSETISPNNSVALENRAQLEALQAWIRETEAARKETVNEK